MIVLCVLFLSYICILYSCLSLIESCIVVRCLYSCLILVKSSEPYISYAIHIMNNMHAYRMYWIPLVSHVFCLHAQYLWCATRGIEGGWGVGGGGMYLEDSSMASLTSVSFDSCSTHAGVGDPFDLLSPTHSLFRPPLRSLARTFTSQVQTWLRFVICACLLGK